MKDEDGGRLNGACLPTEWGSLRFQFLIPEQIQPEILNAWGMLAQASPNWYQMYQSPIWWQYLSAFKDHQELRLAVLLSANGELVAVAPLCKVKRRFSLGGIQRVLPLSQHYSWEVLGGEPLFRNHGDAEQLWARFAEEILAFTDGMAVFSKSIPSHGPIGKWLANTERSTDRIYPIVETGPRALLGIRLPSSLDEYYGKFSGKTRSTLRRKTKMLQEQRGRVELVRVEKPEQIVDFLDRATRVSEKSWQYRREGKQVPTSPSETAALALLAHQGLLRSYLLKAGDFDCAFCLGYQYNNVFHYANLGFDEALASLSPGIVLLTEILRDLWDYRTPSLLNFGVGEAEYKRRFGNCELSDKSVLFTRPGLLNWAWWGMHSRLADLRTIAKRSLRT